MLPGPELLGLLSVLARSHGRTSHLAQAPPPEAVPQHGATTPSTCLFLYVSFPPRRESSTILLNNSQPVPHSRSATCLLQQPARILLGLIDGYAILLTNYFFGTL